MNGSLRIHGLLRRIARRSSSSLPKAFSRHCATREGGAQTCRSGPRSQAEAPASRLWSSQHGLPAEHAAARRRTHLPHGLTATSRARAPKRSVVVWLIAPLPAGTGNGWLRAQEAGAERDYAAIRPISIGGAISSGGGGWGAGDAPHGALVERRRAHVALPPEE